MEPVHTHSTVLLPFRPQQLIKCILSFQSIASYVCYSKEKMADLLFGLKFVKLSILPTLFIHFV